MKHPKVRQMKNTWPLRNLLYIPITVLLSEKRQDVYPPVDPSEMKPNVIYYSFYAATIIFMYKQSGKLFHFSMASDDDRIESLPLVEELLKSGYTIDSAMDFAFL